MITTEIRYFFEPETLPYPKLIKAFELESETARTDHYFCFEKAFSSGVKWREGRLEVKALVAQTKEGGLVLSDWEKISVETGGNEPTGNYVPVQKKRWTVYLDRHFQKNQPGEGLSCQVEYCQLSMNKEEWESLCLEAIGGTHEDRKRLVLGLHQKLLMEVPELNGLLTEKNRKSYPELIHQVKACEGR